jgi:hypothetical protein
MSSEARSALPAPVAVQSQPQHRRRCARRAGGDQRSARRPPDKPPSEPSCYKVNPAAEPIAILAMTSETLTRGRIYDAPRGSCSRHCHTSRVELNPLALFKYGTGLEDVRAALASANAHSPNKGAIEDGDRRYRSMPTTRRTMPRTISRS